MTLPGRIRLVLKVLLKVIKQLIILLLYVLVAHLLGNLKKRFLVRYLLIVAKILNESLDLFHLKQYIFVGTLVKARVYDFGLLGYCVWRGNFRPVERTLQVRNQVVIHFGVFARLSGQELLL